MSMRRNLPRIADALRAAADICITRPDLFGVAIAEGADALGVSVFDVWAVVDKLSPEPSRFSVHRSPEKKMQVCLEIAARIDDIHADGEALVLFPAVVEELADEVGDDCLED